MPLFIFSILLALAGTVLLAVPALLPGRTLGKAVGGLVLAIALGILALSTAIYVDDDKGGIVVRKFGPNLPDNRIVAAHDEKGPQAGVLGPGWHFGYWPWLYDLVLVPTVTIEQGQVGIVMAFDGKSLPEGQVFAPKWDSADQLLDGQYFLTEGNGLRGPQLTVLTPGRYRYNPRLYSIEAKPVLTVAAGEVAVIKSNTGETLETGVEMVNGTPLVPEGHRGIWKTPKTPGQYYLHPDAFHVVKVRTTNRTYVYQDAKYALRVRSKDGFTFPVDVRLSINISGAEAPGLVALLGDPDGADKDDQEDEVLTVLEARIILPMIRAVFRNVAEGMNALQFVNSRSLVEQQVTQVVREDLKKYRILCEGVFIGNIDLDASDAGKQLLSTQTEREVAVNQQATYREKQNAEEARARFTLAQEEAEQQRNLAQAKYQVLVREQEAKAREVEAQGEARYIEITSLAKKAAYEQIATSIGKEGVTLLEALKLVAEGKIQIAPQVLVNGSGSAGDALMGTILHRMVEPKPAATAK